VEPPPQIAWSPNGKKFVFVYNGNLYLADIEGAPPRQLTSNNQSGQPRWAAGRTARESIELRSTPTITSTSTVTASDVMTRTDDTQ
jgi:Tol biopolymer transport system component